MRESTRFAEIFSKNSRYIINEIYITNEIIRKY